MGKKIQIPFGMEKLHVNDYSSILLKEKSKIKRKKKIKMETSAK